MIKNCLYFDIYKNGIQIGFGRVTTDYTVFAYLMDVFIISQHQKKATLNNLLKLLLMQKS